MKIPSCKLAAEFRTWGVTSKRGQQEHLNVEDCTSLKNIIIGALAVGTVALFGSGAIGDPGADAEYMD